MTNEIWLTLSQSIVALGLVVAALGGYGAHHFGKKIEKEADAKAAYSGTLKATTQVLLAAEQHVWPQLEFGDSGAILKYTGPAGSPLFKFGEDSNLTVLSRNGQLKVSVAIRDKTGRLIAEILENDWKIKPNNSWDRNYSSDAVEVRDSSGDIVLQVRALPDRIQLQAKLYDSSGRGIALGKTKGGGTIEMTGPNHPDLTLKIEPLFRYPSSSHLGQLANGA